MARNAIERPVYAIERPKKWPEKWPEPFQNWPLWCFVPLFVHRLDATERPKMARNATERSKWPEKWPQWPEGHPDFSLELQRKVASGQKSGHFTY